MKKTFSPKAKEIIRNWHEIDLKDQTLGRIATIMAGLLMGKGKPYFVYHMDCGDYIVAKNAKYIKVTGRKIEQKEYLSHSGYPGGFRKEYLKNLIVDNPEKVITEAVKGMLPQNKLRASMLKRLYIYSDEKHPYSEKFK